MTPRAHPEPPPPPAGAEPTLRVFEYWLESHHGLQDNELVHVACERLVEEGWQPYTVEMTGPPFATFIYSAFACQLAYLRMNAAERGLAVDRVRGRLRMVTEDWVVQEIEAEFWIHARSGMATAEDLAYIEDRMRSCPVSRNLPTARKQTVLHVE